MSMVIRVSSIFAVISLSIVSYVSASSAVPPPTTIDEYMSSSDVIVIGRIGQMVKAHTFHGYQDNAAELERLDSEAGMSLGVPMVDYEVVVEEVIATDSYYRRDTGDSLIVRVMRNHDQLDRHSHWEDSGRFLLFLSRNPDNATYGFYSFGHKVNIDEERPKYYFGGEAFDVLSGNTSRSELIAEVRRKVLRSN